MTRRDLDEFVEPYNADVRQKRKATWSDDNPEGRWSNYTYDFIVGRDKASLDIF